MTSTGNLEILKELKLSGFTKHGIVEVVLVTQNFDGSPNAAPIVVKLVDGSLELKSYRGSKTYENLKRTKRAIINVTHDPLLFLYTSFKDEFVKQPKILPDLTLKDADSYIIVDLISEKSHSEEWSIYKATPVDFVKRRKNPIVFSRGRAAAIEAIIHATRVKAFINKGKEAEVKELTRKIEACSRTVNRVSPIDSPEHLVIDNLGKLLEKWRDQS